MDLLRNTKNQQDEIRLFIKKARNELHFPCGKKHA